MGTTKWGVRRMGEKVLPAGCLCLATSCTRPWDHGAEQLPAAGQPPLQDTSAKTSGSLMLCWLLQLMGDPSCACRRSPGNVTPAVGLSHSIKAGSNIARKCSGLQSRKSGFLVYVRALALVCRSHLLDPHGLEPGFARPAQVAKSSRNGGRDMKCSSDSCG